MVSCKRSQVSAPIEALAKPLSKRLNKERHFHNKRFFRRVLPISLLLESPAEESDGDWMLFDIAAVGVGPGELLLHWGALVLQREELADHALQPSLEPLWFQFKVPRTQASRGMSVGFRPDYLVKKATGIEVHRLLLDNAA